MNWVFWALALLPPLLWALGGFKLHELAYEWRRLAVWYVGLAILYGIYRLVLLIF